MPPKRRQSKKQIIERDAINKQVFHLALNKLIGDYWQSRGYYRDGIEKYFEEWIFSNFYTWTEDFENKLLSAFLAMVLVRGRQPGKTK